MRPVFYLTRTVEHNDKHYILIIFECDQEINVASSMINDFFYLQSGLNFDLMNAICHGKKTVTF